MNTQAVVITGDGSHSILDEERHVTYHSMHGAITESMHVFIKHGLEFAASSRAEISILEVGFGTGLNALLTFLYTRAHPQLFIRYTSIEKNPLPIDVVAQLNYVTQLDAGQYQDVFQRMHAHHILETEQLHFNLIVADILDFTGQQNFDLIYFDAFAPNTQPEIWEPIVFQHLKDLMSPQGILVTYCAQGQFKRTLKQLGFLVETLPGPPGKREMVRAILNS